VVLAMEASLVAIEEMEAAGFIAESLKGQGGADAGLACGGIELIHFRFQAGALNGPDAQETPAADGHVFNQGPLDFVLGMEVVIEGAEEIGEGLEIFVFEDDGSGEQAVTQAVGGGTALGFGSIGSGRLGAIGARGADSTFGTHDLRVGHGSAVIGDREAEVVVNKGKIKLEIVN
jgi:hypothetical protein